MKQGTAKAGDRVIEDYDFGDREARVGTVKRVREPRYPSDRGASRTVRSYSSIGSSSVAGGSSNVSSTFERSGSRRAILTS